MNAWWFDGEEYHSESSEDAAKAAAELQFRRMMADCNDGEHYWEFVQQIAWGVQTTRGHVVLSDAVCDCDPEHLQDGYHECSAFEASDIEPGDSFEVADLVPVDDPDELIAAIVAAVRDATS